MTDQNDKKKSNAGRPKIEFDDKDWQIVEEGCAAWATAEEIAGYLRVSVDTLERRIKEKHGVNFAEFYKEHSAGGKMSLRRAQLKNAVENNNATLQIWLGKNYLGQKDHHDITHTGPIKLQYSLDDNEKSGADTDND